MHSLPIQQAVTLGLLIANAAVWFSIVERLAP